MNLYNDLQTWWLDSAGGAGLLFLLRVLTFCMATFAAISWGQLARLPIPESTWSERTAKTFDVLCWLMALGAAAAASYFFLGGLLEYARPTSPHRLLYANIAFCLLFAPLALVAQFLRKAWAEKFVKKAQRAKAGQ